jgi:voltage-gated potassium channel
MFRFQLFSKIYFSVFLLLSVLTIGVVGYVVIEDYSMFDAFYMTIITVSTVGYGEVHILSDAGKLFTTFLIITSFGTFAYAVSSISKYVIDGDFNRNYKIYKVNEAVRKLENHVIVCGYGRNGKQAAHVLKKHNKRFVVIEDSKDVVSVINHQYSDLVLKGDAKDDEMLKRAGIAKATALITTLPIDADNLFIVLTARYLNPKLTIISRASEDSSDAKLRIAGADNIIMPDKIGGAHMASLVMKPDVMEFVDVITGQGDDNIRLEEITFSSLPEKYQNKTIRELAIGSKSGANVVGFKVSQSEYIINPSADTIIIPGAKLFVLGTSDQIQALKELLS